MSFGWRVKQSPEQFYHKCPLAQQFTLHFTQHTEHMHCGALQGTHVNYQVTRSEVTTQNTHNSVTTFWILILT